MCGCCCFSKIIKNNQYQQLFSFCHSDLHAVLCQPPVSIWVYTHTYIHMYIHIWWCWSQAHIIVVVFSCIWLRNATNKFTINAKFYFCSKRAAAGCNCFLAVIDCYGWVAVSLLLLALCMCIAIVRNKRLPQNFYYLKLTSLKIGMEMEKYLRKCKSTLTPTYKHIHTYILLPICIYIWYKKGFTTACLCRYVFCYCMRFSFLWFVNFWRAFL